ncbi:glycosyl hydrolase [Paenibacillus campinasensis]|uniref:Glycosyl hydrolase n=2 Tax=Paenibacillus campinasensis TaxID=66347 RepID=A0ABW9T491_9BACL|nr:glycosyl hydrolase [Paenibacillus campinasensis]
MGGIRLARRKRRRGRGFMNIVVIILAVLIGWTVSERLPNRTHITPDWKGMEKPIFVQGEMMSHAALGEGEALKLPLPAVQEAVDPHIWYEEETASVIITTPDHVMRMGAEREDAELDGKALTLKHAPEVIEGTPYIPVEPLQQYLGIAVHEDRSTGAVILMRAGDSIQLAEAAPAKRDGTIAVRESGSHKAPIVLDMKAGERLRVWREEGEWFYVQADNGYTGYVKQDQVELGGVKDIPVQAFTPSRAELEWKDKQVNLVWEAVYSRNPNTADIGPMPGVNVVSPTWFSITSGTGEVKSKAAPAYVAWAHQRGYEVWGLLDNSFDPDLTTEALSSYNRRSHIIQQMIAYAKQYRLDGINIDFENVYTADKDHVVQFVREFRPYAKANGLILSIDVTPKSNSEMWSVFLDRSRLGEAVDYMMVMAYDEHWASSPRAGSVASLPWTEVSVRRIIEEDGVPPSKLVLGIPLYTRVWTETGGDEPKVSSSAVGMRRAQEIVKEQKLEGVLDERAGQNYVEYKDGDDTVRIWLEDELSLQSRVDLAQRLELGGIATWNRSFALPEAWDVLKSVHE